MKVTPGQKHSVTIYVVSDSVGDTGEMLVNAAIKQFELDQFELRRVPYVQSIEQIDQALAEIAAVNGVVIYTMVCRELKYYLRRRADELELFSVDVMGPIITALKEATGLTPLREPGLLHKMDEAYFDKIAAIEFAIRHDDGKEPAGLLRADIVIVGLSRVSKTPLCMYLAHKGLKAANQPLIPEVKPPLELFQIDPAKIIGLTINASLLLTIRQERLHTMGLVGDNNYANRRRIAEEIAYAENIMRQLGCPIVDATNKATEETATKVLELFTERAG